MMRAGRGGGGRCIPAAGAGSLKMGVGGRKPSPAMVHGWFTHAVGASSPVPAHALAPAVIFLAASTSERTEATDLSNIAFSSALSEISTTRSAPLAPITTGTPT